MLDSLPVLERQRSLLLQQISELGVFRSGSITAVMKRCGKPTCHCAGLKDTGPTCGSLTK